MFPKNISKMKKNIPMNKFIIMFKYIPAILATLLNIMTVHVHAQERWCKQKASKRISLHLTVGKKISDCFSLPLLSKYK